MFTTIINDLINGNKRFATCKSQLNKQIKLNTISYNTQQPKTVILCCVDSRISPELIFDQPIETFLCSRTPGNIITNEVIATIELGILKFNTQLIIILGHTDCAAIKLANSNTIINGYLNNIATTIKNDNINTSKHQHITTINNIHIQIQKLITTSKITKNACNKNLTHIIGGIFNLKTSYVDFINNNNKC